MNMNLSNPENACEGQMYEKKNNIYEILITLKEKEETK